MQFSNNGNFKVCGTPYAVCIAETPEEAVKLEHFMKTLQSGHTCTCESDYEGYAIEHGHSDGCGWRLNDELFDTLDNAKKAAQCMCEGISDAECIIYGLTTVSSGEAVSTIDFTDRRR